MDHLAREALNAKRAGLSYGQFKALKYNPAAVELAPPQRKEDENIYKCETCGREFFSYTHRKFCSNSCRTLSYYKPVEPTERNCIQCGKPFMAVGGQKKLCSDACKQERYRERHRKAAEEYRAKKTMGK